MSQTALETTKRPRRLSFHGTVVAHGYWFPAAVYAEPLAVRRIVALWRPGAVVKRTPHGLVLTFPKGERIAVDEAPGAPLVRVGEGLASAPLPTHGVSLPAGSLWLVEHGAGVTVDGADLAEVDPAAWVDFHQYRVVDVAPLGAAAEPSESVTRPERLHELFDGRIGRGESDRQRIARFHHALALASAHDRPGGAAVIARALLSRLRQWLGRTLGATSGAATSGSARSRSLATRPHQDTGETFWVRIRRRFAETLWRSRLMAVLGRAHARYLDRLLDMLDGHHDLDVLRHAIPLSNRADKQAAPALAPPGPRAHVGISLARRGGTSALPLHEQLFARLRVSYEAVFERLDRAGKHDEAAFVLAELLDDAARAVAYLERHGQLRLAAQIAEARELPPSLVVRQWFLANERERACAIAAREGAFQDAIARLERSGHNEEARALRLLYGERLAASGALSLAARTVSDVPEAHPLALRWLTLAREGGDLSSTALELRLAPDRFDLVWRAVEPCLRHTTPDALGVLMRLSSTILEEQPAAARPIARELARELLATAGATGDASIEQAAARLADWVGGPMRADMPPVATFERRAPAAPVEARFARSDTGSRTVSDAVVLDARLVVAFGEAGVGYLDARGRAIAHFDVPADHLVVCDTRPHVLAIARRGDACRISRIHLGSRKARCWTELRLDAYARRFDGERWLVSPRTSLDAEGELHVLDVVSDEPMILRRIPLSGDGMRAMRIDVGERFVNVFGAESFGALEHLVYANPDLVLRRRNKVNFGEDVPNSIYAGSASADDEATVAWDARLLPGEGWLRPALRHGDDVFPLPEGDLAGQTHVETRGGLVAACVRTDHGARVLVGNLTTRRFSVDALFECTEDASVRLAPPLAIVADGLGRLCAFDAMTGRRIHDLRV